MLLKQINNINRLKNVNLLHQFGADVWTSSRTVQIITAVWAICNAFQALVTGAVNVLKN